jgi:hypothetical protein
MRFSFILCLILTSLFLPGCKSGESATGHAAIVYPSASPVSLPRNAPVAVPENRPNVCALADSLPQFVVCSIDELVTVKPVRGGPVPLKVRFNAAASIARCGNIVRYIWDFGDGARAAGARTSHIYKTAGSYIAKVTINDDSGNVNRSQQQYTINVTSGPPSLGQFHPVPAQPMRRRRSRLQDLISQNILRSPSEEISPLTYALSAGLRLPRKHQRAQKALLPSL